MIRKDLGICRQKLPNPKNREKHNIKQKWTVLEICGTEIKRPNVSTAEVQEQREKEKGTEKAVRRNNPFPQVTNFVKSINLQI